MRKPPFTQGNISGTRFRRRQNRSQGYIAVERIMSMKNSNNTIRDRPATSCAFAYKRNKKLFFFHKFNQCCQTSKISHWILPIMIARARRYYTQHATCWYRLLTADHSIRSDPSICFAVTSRVLPRTSIKSIRKIIMVRNRKRNTVIYTV